MTKFDEICAHGNGPHTSMIGLSGSFPNAIGGWFTIMTKSIVPVYVFSLFVVFIYDNTREEQSLLPYFGETISADMVFTVKLAGYSAATCDLAHRHTHTK